MQNVCGVENRIEEAIVAQLVEHVIGRSQSAHYVGNDIVNLE